MQTNKSNSRLIPPLFILFLALFTANRSQADSFTWIGGDSPNPNSWKDARNWNTGSTPGSQDDVIIPTTGNNPILDMTVIIGSLTISESGAILLLDGTHNLTVNGNVNISASGAQLLTGKATITIKGSILGQGKLDLTGNGTAQIAGNMSVNTFDPGSGQKSTILLNGINQNITKSYQFDNLRVGTTATTTANFLADETVNVMLCGSGTLNCGNHILNLEGDMTVKTFNADSGTVNLTGYINSQSQDINGYTFYNLSVDNSKTYLNGNVGISHNLSFISGDILLRSYNLTIMPSAGMTWDGNSTHIDFTTGYIVTCGTGHLTMTATMTGTIFPIGYSITEYNPVTITSISGNVVCDASVSEGVTDGYNTVVTANAVNETWLIVPHAAGSVTVTPQWTNGTQGDQNQELPFFNRALAQVNERTTQTNPSPWSTIGTAGQATGGDPWSRSSASFAVLTNTNYYIYIAGGSIAPLPVTLTSFDAIYENGQVNLKWITVSEINNNRFEIERSTNGNEWTTIGNVAGHGTTQEENAYFTTDNLQSIIATGTLYYRLKQVDFNGNFTYSMIKSVNITNVPLSIEMYPNPVHDNLNIIWTCSEGSTTILKIINTNGTSIYSAVLNSSGMMHQQINIGGYPAGNYIVQVLGDAGTTSKMIYKE